MGRPQCATVWLLIALSQGCGGATGSGELSPSLLPGQVPAETPGQQQLLAQLSSLPSDQPVRLGDETFTPEAPYAAASGRVCRGISVNGSDHYRVACLAKARWTFVPEVLVGGVGEAP